MNSAIGLNFKVRFIFFYTCGFREQCIKLSQKTQPPIQTQTQTRCYPN